MHFEPPIKTSSPPIRIAQASGAGPVSAWGESGRQAPQGDLGAMIQRSGRMAVQRKRLAQMFGGTAQLLKPEEETKQAKMPAQAAGKLEDEKVGQSKAVQRKAGPNSLPDPVRGKMERAMNADFSNVAIHQNSAQAGRIGALAYTQGSNVHFAQGKFDPGSHAGQQLIGHELAHVVQQRQGRVAATGEIGGMALNDDAGLEQEADRMGQKAASISSHA